jgi:hypothetical protein
MTITPSQNRTLFNELAAVLREGQLLFPIAQLFEQSIFTKQIFGVFVVF